MLNPELVSISEAANSLEISEAVVDKIIERGLLPTIKNGASNMLTPYGIRRLTRIINMYAQSFSTENIEKALNHH